MRTHVGADEDAVVRRAVLRHLLSEPGATAHVMVADLTLSGAKLQYSLLFLERNQWIVSRRDGTELRYFPSHREDKRARAVLGALQDDSVRRIVMGLLEEPNASSHELSRTSGLEASDFDRAVARLEKERIIERWSGERLRLLNPQLVAVTEILRAMEVSVLSPQERRTLL